MRFFDLATFAVLGSLVCFGNGVKAEMLDPTVGPNEIGAVSVAMNDSAVDACWTNLKEVREYTEEKLRIQGYELSGDDRALVDYTLVIDVTGYRSKAAPVCVGSIIVMLVKGSVNEDIFGLHVINMENVVTTSPRNGNLNDRVIEIVQKTVDSM